MRRLKLRRRNLSKIHIFKSGYYEKKLHTHAFLPQYSPVHFITLKLSLYVLPRRCGREYINSYKNDWFYKDCVHLVNLSNEACIFMVKRRNERTKNRSSKTKSQKNFPKTNVCTSHINLRKSPCSFQSEQKQLFSHFALPRLIRPFLRKLILIAAKSCWINISCQSSAGRVQNNFQKHVCFHTSQSKMRCVWA